MISDQYGQLIYSDGDIIDLVMQGRPITELEQLIVDRSVNIDCLSEVLELVPNFVQYQLLAESVKEFDQRLQRHWHMPAEYQDMDIAAHVLSLCTTQAELQRCGEELLLYQERGLFDLLQYLTYLVAVMTKHNIIWGVGRGSSVSSYVLYLLKVHRINSMYYNLDIREFLR